MRRVLRFDEGRAAPACLMEVSEKIGEGSSRAASEDPCAGVHRDRTARTPRRAPRVWRGRPMDAAEVCYLPAVEMAAAIRSKKLSPVEVVDAVLARLDRLNPTLNAYCTVTGVAARASAREAEAAVMRGGPLGNLHGIPVSIKDLVMTKGVRTT